MKQQLNEIKRLQKIAGLLKEGEDLDLSDTPKFTRSTASKIKNLPISVLDSIAKTLSSTAKKRGCYDITKETDLNTISNRDFIVYKYGAFACDLYSDVLRILYGLRIVSIGSFIDSFDDIDSPDSVEILLDRLEQERLLYVEW